MTRCPVCSSARISLHLDASPEGTCLVCGSRWSQRGGSQRKVRRRDDAATGEGGRTLVAVEAPSECPSCGRVTQFIRDPGGRWVLCVRCGRSIDIVAPSPAG